ncbi:hypothetical protein BD410DRAFT_302710 [Rickenella mellea]|uniref:Uncharacterized protein n=1 Tax=Rickenella mellea TaxID=50990 RepID=A0A4Y7Q145_9AGAM|nr:hypothetical protein BD410DRAFT_302710 [Rickenella mellea]
MISSRTLRVWKLWTRPALPRMFSTVQAWVLIVVVSLPWSLLIHQVTYSRGNILPLISPIAAESKEDIDFATAEVISPPETDIRAAHPVVYLRGLSIPSFFLIMNRSSLPPPFLQGHYDILPRIYKCLMLHFLRCQ